MFTRPTNVGDAEIVSVLGERWGLNVVTLAYLAVGFGSHHWRATTAAGMWFVTLDDLVAKRREPGHDARDTRAQLVAALATAAALHDADFEFVVAPVPTRGGQMVCDLGDRYAVSVYPNIEGRTYDYGSYSDTAHRNAVLDNLARLHRAPVACRRLALTETFSISRRAELSASYSQLQTRWRTGPFADPARRLLAQHADAVAGAFKTYDALTIEVTAQSQRFVLTHGEPHPANTITTDDGVVLVDWDTTLIAPPERDLWDLVADEPTVSAEYEVLTGTTVNDDAVELYRLAWDLNEIAIYVSDFRRPHERTEDTSEAWQNLQHFLDPSRW